MPSAAVGPHQIAPSTTREDLQAVMGQVVPGVDGLIAETAAFRGDYSSASNCRQKSSAVELWASNECRCFWEAQRARVIHILLDAAIDHPKKPGTSKRTRTRTTPTPRCLLSSPGPTRGWQRSWPPAVATFVARH